ncbi:MAG: hypothetical protein JO270_13605 [Acidobacteriaceae bacterium]|nr:hypothetical protein [Acidobacteriaceae bacterium]
MAIGKSRNCPGCVAGANIGSITGTSSTGWYGSRVPFEHYRYREDLFPTSWFRLAYDALREEHGPKRGAKEYLQILALAAKRREAFGRRNDSRATWPA